MLGRSTSRLTGRVCAATSATIVDMSHSGAAARPALLAQHGGAAVCSMGARGGRLSGSVEMRIRAEPGATLMVDSLQPVNLLPASEEYGIGIHASVESGALLVITPDAHVPHREAHTGLWTRYDVSPSASLVSVQLADLKAQAARPRVTGGSLRYTGGRYTVGGYTSRTRVHHTSIHGNGTEAGADALFRDHTSLRDHIGASCALPAVSSCGLPFAAQPSWECDWSYGRRFSGLVMGTPTTNVIATVVVAGPRADGVASRLEAIDGAAATHQGLGLLGDLHLALQPMSLPGGTLLVARLAAERREDMHRLLGHALAPLEAQLGVAPYARLLRAESTASVSHGATFAPPRFESRGAWAAVEPAAVPAPSREAAAGHIHVQHAQPVQGQVRQ